jgi:hypothetical protein
VERDVDSPNTLEKVSRDSKVHNLLALLYHVPKMGDHSPFDRRQSTDLNKRCAATTSDDNGFCGIHNSLLVLVVVKLTGCRGEFFFRLYDFACCAKYSRRTIVDEHYSSLVRDASTYVLAM